MIILGILVICFGGRLLINKIMDMKADKSEMSEDVAEETETMEPVSAPVINIETATISDEMDENTVTEMKINTEDEFYIAEISDELFEKMKGKSFKDDCTLAREDLRYVHVLHKTLDGETLPGELVVNYHIAKETLNIFKELYEADYPIEKIHLIDEYDADDERSMSDNNSSSFNFRFISRTTKVSKHGLGLAIDINPLYNPYITTVNGQQNVEPANATDYVDRDADFAYKITHDDLAFKLFKENGFAWGGDWKNSKDYQHFEIPSDKIKEWYPNQ